MALAIMTIRSINLYGEYSELFKLRTAHRASLILVAAIATISDAILGIFVGELTWYPIHRAARSCMMISSVLQFTIGSLLIVANRQPYEDRCARLIHSGTFALHQHIGSTISAAAMLGFAVSTAIHETNRSNELFTRFIHLYNLLAVLIALLCGVLIVLSLKLMLDSYLHSIIKQGILKSNPILAGIALILQIINLVAARYLQEPPLSNLAVEPIDLAALTPSQRAAYATLITRYGKSVPGSPSGEAAISLMLSYSSTALPTMTCTVLRLFKPSKEKSQNLPSNAHRNSKMDEYDRAWRNLDEEKMVLRQSKESPLYSSPMWEASPSTPNLSKYAQKKLARKRAVAEAKDNKVAIDPPEYIPSPAANLEATEASAVEDDRNTDMTSACVRKGSRTSK
jgi:hypothetical protein